MLRCTSTLSITTWKNSGGDQRKELQEERGDEHFGEKPPVFVNCTEEPRDIETSGEIEQSGPPRHEYETPVPDRLELGLGHQCRSRRRWRLHEHLVLAGFAEEHEPAILERRNGRERAIGQARPRGLARAGLEPELGGHPQHFGDANGRAAEAVADLLGIGTNSKKAQQRNLE